MNQATLTEMFFSPPLWLAFVFSAAFAGGSWGLRLLTRSGAISTALVGFLIFGFGGGKFLAPLLAFFFTSSALSQLGKARKAQANAGEAKGATRDAAQVWANGGLAVALTLAFAYASHTLPPYKTRTLLMLYLAALATMNADTWATEIGKLARTAPRLLTNWRPVAAGTSGAISGLGLVGAVAGATLIPMVSWKLWNLHIAEIGAVAWAGFLGSFIDSLLGASLQARYRDPQTGQLTERPIVDHRRMTHIGGLRWVTNDVVNFLAGVGGVLCAWAMLHYGVYPVFR